MLGPNGVPSHQAHARSRARVEELRARVGPAEHRDRQALGAALVDGKAAPASEAEKLKAELAQEEQNLEALTQAVGDAYGQTGRLVRDSRDAWRGQTLRELGKAKSRYEEAIAELEAAREGLRNEATLLNWLSAGDIGETSSSLAFTGTLDELRRDCEYLADVHLFTRDARIPEPQWQLAHGAGVQGMRWEP
jgi:hypothetical protein